MKSIGIDLGNFYDKSSECKKVEARIKEKTELVNSSNFIVEFNGKTYNIGTGKFDPTINKSEKNDLLLRLASILAISTDDSDIKLGLSLPLTQFKNYGREIVKIIKKNPVLKIKGTYCDSHFNKVFRINELRINPEGFAAYLALPNKFISECIEKKYNVLLIDIGGKSLDFCVMSPTAGMIEYDTSFHLGSLELYKKILKKFNEKYPSYTLELEDINDLAINKKYILPNDTELDISFIDDLIEDFCVSVRDYILSAYPKYETCKVVLSGGTGMLLSDYFKKLDIFKGFYHQNDIYANAKGNRIAVENKEGNIIIDVKETSDNY